LATPSGELAGVQFAPFGRKRKCGASNFANPTAEKTQPVIVPKEWDGYKVANLHPKGARTHGRDDRYLGWLQAYGRRTLHE
jgi:hypothetical protein